jgi:hypothetical protein
VGLAGSLHAMNLFKMIFLTLAGLARQFWLLPQSIAIALKQKRERIAVDEFEADRLDRLRNPSKYQGK